MKYSRLATMMAYVACIVVAGCLPSEPPGTEGTQSQNAPAQVTPEQLVATLKYMSTKPDEYSETIDRHVLTQQLANTGPTALMPLVEYMGAPDTDQDARLFTLQCIYKYMTPEYLPALQKLFHSEDVVVRASAVMCLGSIENEASQALLRDALDDSSPRVRFSAMSGLAIQGDEESRSQLKGMYTADETMGDIPIPQIKREVVRVLVQDPRKDDLAILEDALEQEFLEVNLRSMIAQALGRMGEARHIALLEQSVHLQDEPVYGEIVQDAIAAIQEREGKA